MFYGCLFAREIDFWPGREIGVNSFRCVYGFECLNSRYETCDCRGSEIEVFLCSLELTLSGGDGVWTLKRSGKLLRVTAHARHLVRGQNRVLCPEYFGFKCWKNFASLTGGRNQCDRAVWTG